MPTGYTHHVQDGKITTLRDYALISARAFVALITMRDDSMDAPIPDKFEPDTSYYDKALAAAREVLDRIPHLSDRECDIEAESEFKVAMKVHTESVARNYQEKMRYQNMLAKVEHWKCDDEVRNLKEFMIEQLNSSIKHDDHDDYYRKNRPIRLTAEQWRHKKLEQASRDVAYHTTERDKELQRVAGRNQWLSALRKSLTD